MNAWRCVECGMAPARLAIDGGHLCGVCWHRGRILADLARRIRAWRAERAERAA